MDQNMLDRITGLRRGVNYGIANGKKNMVVDLDLLQVLLGTGDGELQSQAITERFYKVREQRDKLLHLMRAVGSSLAQAEQIPPIVTRDLADRCSQLNQELNLI